MIFLWLGAALAYFYALHKGIIHFELWGQITDFLEHLTVEGGLTWELMTHIHFFRFLVVSPSILVADSLGFNPDTVFSFQLGLYLFLMPFCLYLYRPYEIRRAYKWSFISFFFIAYALLSLQMNGRIAFAHVGFAISIATLHAWDQGRLRKSLFILFYIISIYLCSVSTGTIFIPPLLLMLYFSVHFILKIRKRGFTRFDIYTLAVLILVLLALSPVIMSQLDKNLSYYDGSIIKMLSHGLGSVFMGLLPLLPFIVMLLIIFAGFFAYLAQKYKFNVIIVMAISVAAFGGLFGYSTLSLIFLPILILLYENIEKAVNFLLSNRQKN